MSYFEVENYVKVISTGRIGQVINRERNLVTVEFCDNLSIDPEECDFKNSELKAVELPKMKTSQLKPFVRGELSLTEITNGVHIVADQVETDSEAYRVTAEDLLAGVNHYDGMPPEDVYRWLDTLLLFSDDMSLPSEPWIEIKDAVTERDILAAAYEEIDDLYFWLWDDKPAELKPETFNSFRELLETWVKSGGKNYPDSIRFQISRQYDSDDIDKQSEATQQLFKEALDYLCDVKKDPKSIQRRGYCYYCGTKIYPNDWVKVRDAFIEYYHMTGDASAANTLGYIYYYGRCNGGVPQYEEAFKYFSIGHAYTYFESTYKLADMLAHGYGVVKDGESANHLYWSVYEQSMKRFVMGEVKNKFADAALRVGNCYKDEIGVKKDLRTAYYYYLQADYAIRERMKAVNYYGDTVVFNGIQKALAEVRKEYTEKGRTVKFAYPEWTNWTLIDHRRCRLKIKKLAGDVLSIDAVLLKRRDEEDAPKMLIVIPKADYCELKDKIHIKTAPGSRYEIADGKEEIVFDSIEYDWSEKKTSFYLYDDCVGVIYTEEYMFTAPVKKKKELSGDIHHFVSVVFDGGSRSYDYLCDDKSVVEGDYVIVNGYDGETKVQVVAVSDKYDSELGIPIDRLKKIVRKV